jgi:hypothetical protein
MRREEKVIAALAATYFPALPSEAAAAKAEGKDPSIVKYFETQGDEFLELSDVVSSWACLFVS